MTSERKVFWAFVWLALAIVGAVYALRQIRVSIVHYVLPTLEAAAPRQRTLLLFRRGSVRVDGSDHVTSAAGVPSSAPAAEQFPERRSGPRPW